ncbi:hypothetical protein GCM10027276_05670 [Comamonas piscis]
MLTEYGRPLGFWPRSDIASPKVMMLSGRIEFAVELDPQAAKMATEAAATAVNMVRRIQFAAMRVP